MKNRIRIARCMTASGYGVSHTLFSAAIAGFSWMAMTGQSNGQLLGDAGDFTVISYAGLTSSGFSAINGDIALSPNNTIIGFDGIGSGGDGMINGSVYYDGLISQNAQLSARTAYNTLAGMAYIPANILTGTDLGGLSLAPGVYHLETSAQLTGNLTLDNTLGDANSVYVIQVGSTLTTAVGSSVTILGETPTIYWQVGSSATLNTNTDFNGNILADSSVSLGTGARLVNGRAIALTGSVTLLGNSLFSPNIVLATAGRFWNGTDNNLWSAMNWSSAINEPDHIALGSDVDVVFSVNTTPINQNTSIDGGDTTISSLTVNDTAAVTIGGPDKLIISTTGLTTGININSGAGLTTISADLELGILPKINVNNTAGLFISGEISGINGLSKSGSGTLTLTGTNIYTGPTAVNNGSVLVGNSSAFGNGALTLNNGTIDTYNSQSLQINVDSYEQTGGLIRMHVEGTDPGTYTQYNVADTATLSGGTVFAYDQSGNYAPAGGDVQNIITTANGLSGTFDPDAPYSRFYDAASDQEIFYHQGDTLLYPTLTYDSDNAYITWVQDSFGSVSGLDLTRNQTSVSNMLDSYQTGDPSDPTGVTTFLNSQSITDLPAMYDLIAPYELTSMFQIGFTNAEIQNANIERHLELVRRGSQWAPAPTSDFVASSDSNGGMAEPYIEPDASKLWNIFAESTVGSATIDGDGNGSGYKFDTAGATVGADRQINKNLIVGVLGSYTNTQANLVDHGSIDVDSYKGAVYATAYANNFYVDALLGLGHNKYDIKRSSLLGYADSSPDGWELDTLINTGYDFHHGPWTITPMASVAYTQVHIDSFTETGSMSTLSYPEQSQDSLRSNIGARIAYTAFYNEMAITPQVRVSWQHEFLNNPQSIDAQFANGNGPLFTVDGPRMDPNRVLISVGLSIQITENLAGYAFYDGQIGNSNYSSNTVSAGVNYKF